jgi:hypothetical protein
MRIVIRCGAEEAQSAKEQGYHGADARSNFGPEWLIQTGWLMIKATFSGGIMRTLRTTSAALALAALAMMLGGCSHKLVATEGQTQVSIYPDEDTYKKLSQMKAQGGVAGMLSGMGENLAAGKLDNQTPVKIISSDDLGSNIEVSDGPSKGMKGFVPKANVD